MRFQKKSTYTTSLKIKNLKNHQTKNKAKSQELPFRTNKLQPVKANFHG